ncbi:MAG: Sb-PDE family phosphodiesterase [Balneolales bacterium]
MLIGDRKFLDAIFFNSITIESVERTENGIQVIVDNPTHISFDLTTATGNDPSLDFFASKTLPSGKQTIIKIYTENPSSINKIDLNFIVENLLIAPETGLPVTLSFLVE